MAKILLLCNRKFICLWVDLLSAEFKGLKISQEPRDVCARIQSTFHNEEQLFYSVDLEAPPSLEATARSAQFFKEHHKSPVTCPWL